MRLGDLMQYIQYIVPLTFLAIWALASLFNREAQPLPPRVGNGREPRPDGPRPGLNTSVATGRPPDRILDRRDAEPTSAGLRPSPADRVATARPTRSLDEGIVVLESDPRRASPPAAVRPAGSVPRRVAGRGRAVADAAAKRTEPPVARALTAELSRSHTPLLDQPESLKRLAQTTLVVPDRGGLSAGATAHSRAMDSPSMTAEALQAVTRSPERLREAFIAAEVLFRPPLSLIRPLPLRRRKP